METIERTRFEKQGNSIDCADWDSFTIVESTMHGFKLHIRKRIDKEPPKTVELPDDETT